VEKYPACKWTLFTIAVRIPGQCHTFPAKLVIGLLDKYHNAKNLFMPLVFTVEDKTDLPGVLKELKHFIFEVNHDRNACPFDPETLFDELPQKAAAFLNYANNVTRLEKDPAKCLEQLQLAKKEVRAVLERAKELFDDGFAASVDPSGATRSKLLVSSQLEELPKMIEKKERNAVLYNINVIIERLNGLIDSAKTGHILSQMSDAELTAAMGHGARTGEHFSKASLLRAAPEDEALRKVMWLLCLILLFFWGGVCQGLLPLCMYSLGFCV
jgi:hypothetical protein